MVVAAALALSAAPAAADQTAGQKFFRDKLLNDDAVAHSVKVALKKGGFVDSTILFADLTGEGKDDAVVMVDSGTAAGDIAMYVFSAGSGKDLKIAYRNQRMYRGEAHVNPGPSLVYSVPQYAAGDELCCPAAYRETTLKWNSKRKRFGVARRRTVTP